MFFQADTLTEDQIRNSFHAAAGQEKSHLLVLEETRASNFFEFEVYTRPISDQSEIAGILKSKNGLNIHGITTKLVGIYDLRGDFDAQHALPGNEQLEKTLTPDAFVAVEAYELARCARNAGLLPALTPQPSTWRRFLPW